MRHWDTAREHIHEVSVPFPPRHQLHLGFPSSLCMGISDFLTNPTTATDCVTRLSPSTSLSTGAPQDCMLSTLHQWLYYSPSDKHHHWLCLWRGCDWAHRNGRWGSEWIQSHCGLMELVRKNLWLFRAQPLKVSTKKKLWHGSSSRKDLTAAAQTAKHPTIITHRPLEIGP